MSAVPYAPDAADARPAAQAPVVLTRRRIYILPTRYGAGFAAVIGVLLLGSANYNNSLGYLLTFLLAGVALVSILHTYRNLAGLALRAGRARPVFAGEMAGFGLVLDNRGGPPRHGVTIRYRREAAPRASGDAALETDVPADVLHGLTLAVPSRQRGWLRLARATVVTRYPLGLFRAWSHVQLDCACLVYPAPRGAPALPAGRGASGGGGRGGEAGDDFSGLREYLPGDSPRQIHWKAAARGQGIPVKLFGGGGAGELWLDWADAQGANVEARLGQLCRWVLEAEARGCRYGLILPGLRLRPDCGERHHRRCLEALALFDAAGAA